MSHKLTLLLIIIIHYIIFFSFAATATAGAFVLPFYVGITLIALIGRVIFSPVECPLTTLENAYRKKLTLLPSKGFLKDYILYPRRTFYTLYVELYKK